jgi:hypothetical protein
MSYHSGNRGVRQGLLFLGPEDHRVYRRHLARSAREFDVQVIAACEMPNHDHLLHLCEPEKRAPFLQKLHWQFARDWNRRHDKHGHVFEERSWSFERWGQSGLGSIPHVSAYIFLNPEVAELCRARDYPYSLYRAYLGQAPMPDYVNPALLLNCFSPDPRVARRRLEAYVDSYAAHVARIQEAKCRWLGEHKKGLGYAANMLGHVEILTLTAEVLKGRLPQQFAGMELEELLSLALNRFEGVRQAAVATALRLPKRQAERLWSRVKVYAGEHPEAVLEAGRLIDLSLLPDCRVSDGQEGDK